MPNFPGLDNMYQVNFEEKVWDTQAKKSITVIIK